MKRRKMRHGGEVFEFERRIEVRVDVVEHAVHALRVFVLRPAGTGRRGRGRYIAV